MDPPAKRQTTPSEYALAHREKLLARAKGDLGKLLGKVREQAWFGVPPAAWLGFTQIATSDVENTTEGVPAQPFHEVGYFQTPAGPRSGPAPNPDPHAANNAWGRHATTAYVRDAIAAMTGTARAASMVPDGWKHDVPGQVAVGLADLRANMTAVSKQLGAAGSSDPNSTWAVGLSFMGFSSGATSAAHAIKPYATALASVPERKRWSAYGDLLDRDVRAGASWQITRPYMSAWRKFAGGTLVSMDTATLPLWTLWYDRPRADVDSWVRASRIEQGLTSADSSAGGVLLVAGVAGLAWWWSRRKRRNGRK